MQMLCRDGLSVEERMYLSNLSIHPGFLVLKKMIQEACQKANEQVISLNPVDPDFDRKLKVLVVTARAMNSFAASLIKSVQAHVEDSGQSEMPETEEVDLQKMLKIFGR